MPVTARSINRQPEVKVRDPWLAKTKEAFETSTTFLDTNYRKDWEDSIAHFQSRHMAGSKYYTDRYALRSKGFRPKTRSIVRNIEAATAAAFFSQLEVIDFEAEDDTDPIQNAGAVLRKELLNYRLTGKGQIPWFQTCIGAMQETQVYGIVGSKQFWDFQAKDNIKIKDQPDIKLYPIENLRFDPASEWTDVVNSSPYFIAMEAMRIGDVKARIDSGEWEKIDDDTLLTARNASYDSTRSARKNDKEDDTDPKFTKALSDFDIVWVHENFLKVDNEDWHCYTLGTIARLSKPRALAQVYLHNRRPFVVGTCMIEPHKAIPDSPVHIAKPTQKAANDIDNLRKDNVQLVLNKRYLVRRGKQVDLQSLVKNAPASVTLVNDIEKDVFPMEFQDVTSSSYAEQDRINVDFDEITGGFSTGTVSTNRKLGETVGGLSLLKGSANFMAQYVIRIFSESWVEKVLNQIDELEQYYESDIGLLNRMAKRADLQKHGIMQINKDILMTPARITVNIANSAMDPMIRLQAFTSAMDLYAKFRAQMPPDLDPEPIKAYIFGLLGFRDAGRFSKNNQDPKLAAAMQEIQQLRGLLESKQLEVESKEKIAAAKLVHDESEAEKERDLKVYLADMKNEIDLFIADMTHAADSADLENSEATKRLAEMLNHRAEQMWANLENKKINVTAATDMAQATTPETAPETAPEPQDARMNDAMMQSIEALKSLMVENKTTRRMLEDIKATVEAPRETEIISRDSQGMPNKSVSRVMKGPTPSLRLGE